MKKDFRTLCIAYLGKCSRSVVYEQDSLDRVIDCQWGGILLHSFLVHHIFKYFKNQTFHSEIKVLCE